MSLHTGRGVRTVPMPDLLVSLLQEHRQDHPGAADELVFRGRDDGPLRRTNFRQRVWLPARARRATRRATFHGLRHCYATWLVSDGVPINVVQRLMGHEQASTTLNRYTYAGDDYDDRVRAVFDPAADPPPAEDRRRVG